MTIDFTGLSSAQPFFVEYERAYIHGNILDAEKGRSPAILFLHGENESEDRNVFLLLRQTLLERYGITSCAFDFVGHGATSGGWGDSSLKSRTEQAATVADACFDSQSFMVVASGMGAYTALKLTQVFAVEGLVLVSPKVYAEEIYNTPLELFKDPKSYAPEHWDKTDAWSIIERFKGSVSIVGTNKSDPLCPGTMSRLYSHSTRAMSRQAFDINSTEQRGELLAYSDQTSLELMRLAKVIRRACDSTVLSERVELTS